MLLEVPRGLLCCVWTHCSDPVVTFPGDVRNDLYLTLERGDFERGGKSVQKNVEVTVMVIYADGEVLKVRTFTHQQVAPPRFWTSNTAAALTLQNLKMDQEHKQRIKSL